MRLELIDCTGMTASDPARYAAELLIYTKNTRLEQGPQLREKVAAMTAEEQDEQLRYIANTIRSSWEFVDYTFQICNVTRAFTHQFVRTRTASFAHQTQRVAELKDISVEKPQSVSDRISSSLSWDNATELLALVYQNMINEGVPAQDARGILPQAVHSNIIAKFNLRALADLIGKRENLRAQGEYANVAGAMKTLVLAIHPWARYFLVPERTATPALDRHLRDYLGDRPPFDVPGFADVLKDVDKLKATWG